MSGAEVRWSREGCNSNYVNPSIHIISFHIISYDRNLVDMTRCDVM